MTCKDCVHYEVCHIVETYGEEDNENCKQFKPKSRFVELPCEVGQTVYVISESRIKEAKLDELHIDRQKRIHLFVIFECHEDCEGCPFEARSQTFFGERDCDNQYGVAWIKESDFGKTVFLSREEAEKALQRKE